MNDVHNERETLKLKQKLIKIINQLVNMNVGLLSGGWTSTVEFPCRVLLFAILLTCIEILLCSLFQEILKYRET
jgi:hypothetical protein